MNVIDTWAATWGISALALADLRHALAAECRPGTRAEEGFSEAAVQSRLRRDLAANPDLLLWRNNVGACEATNGRVIRYGLANDSAQMNDVVASADLIGIYRHIVRPVDVGRALGLFVSIECKKQDWRMPTTPDAALQAQINWATAIATYGGISTFNNGNEPFSLDI